MQERLKHEEELEKEEYERALQQRTRRRSSAKSFNVARGADNEDTKDGDSPLGPGNMRKTVSEAEPH